MSPSKRSPKPKSTGGKRKASAESRPCREAAEGFPEIRPDTTPAEALTLALSLEAGAVGRYSALSKMAAHPITKAKFNALAEEERYHYHYLATLLRSMGETPWRRSKVRLSEASSDIPANAGVPEAVEYARDAERRAGQFYRAAAGKCSNPQARQMFEKLAEDEDRHEAELEQQLRVLRGQAYWSSLEGLPWVEADFWTT